MVPYHTFAWIIEQKFKLQLETLQFQQPYIQETKVLMELPVCEKKCNFVVVLSFWVRVNKILD